uniref:NB-ARC domain-containing protein n=1 Tax=Fagus sylvatica TaxID=28930 RepID=A0A2N9FZJ5_FAGSY
MQRSSKDKNHQVEDWLMKLRDAVYDADDLLSYFSTEELRRKVMGGDEMAKKVRTFFSSSNQLTFGHKMNGKIKVIRGRLDAIASDRNKFQFVERPSRKRVVTRERDQTHSFKPDEKVFGRDIEKETIIDMLLNIDEEDQNVSFISIVGIGGLGKTTLAQYVYNDERVKTYFELQDVVQITLREKLNQKKYLLVLDDVWNENREKWSELEGLLIGGSKGSKVVITTRSRLVARITSRVSPYFLEGLSKDESWSLFKQMAFEKGQVTIDSKLEEIGMGILEKCCGVPLAIKTIGSVLYFKETEEWSNFKDQELTNLNSLQTLPLFVVSKDLEASPSKHCAGLTELNKPSKHCAGLTELNKLNNLRGELCIKNLAWVTDATSEAKSANLKEKRHLRSLELSWDWEDNNNTYVFDDANLLEGLQPHHTLKMLKVKGYRGVSFPSWLPSVTSLVELELSNSLCQYLPPLYQLPSLRELFLENMIGLEYISDREITDEVPASTTFFPSLKSLTLEDCPNLKGWWRRDIVDAATTTSISSDQYQQHITLPSFPCLSDLTIVNCNNLTCMPLFPYLEEKLELVNTSLKPLQETMAMTMNMSATSSLPSSSSSSPPLTKLKSLDLSSIQDVESLPEKLLQNLASLEYLMIRECPRLKSLPRFMQHLTSLKKLDIWKCKELDLFSEESDDGTQCVTTLQELNISVDHRLITLPKGIGNVTPLQRLIIWFCPNLTSLPEGIGNLTSLKSLDIYHCPNLTSLLEGIGNLTSLQILEISECPKLTLLPEGIGKLTSLQSLHISDCPNLTSLPEGIGNLTSLQTLIILKCPDLKERCQKGIGEDWHKIAHIPDFRY